MIIKILFSVTIFITINCSVIAQYDSVALINIQDVIIYENRIQVPLSQKPSGITLVDCKETDHFAVQTISDVLHNIAGVDIRSRGIYGVQNDIGIRGCSFDQVLILIDGIRISDPQTGHHSFNLPLDLSCVDHIEVHKGPSARVFGQNAFAGAINIITKLPAEEFITMKTDAGYFGLAGVNLSASVSGSKIKNYLSLNHNRSSGYKYNTDFQITDLFYHSEYQNRYGQVSLITGLTSRKFGANGFYSSPDNKDQYEAIQTSLVALNFSPDIKNRMVKLTNRFYWRRNRDEYIFIRSDPSYYRNLHINNIVGLDANLSYQNKLGVTGVGLDLSAPWITSNRLGNRSRTDLTLFLEHRVRLLDGNVSIAPGIQINLFSGFENNILPGIDIGCTISPEIMIFINSGYTYRVPTFTDLYYEDPVNSSNPQLQPEYAFSNEIGVKTLKNNGLSGQFSIFSRKNYNLIDRSKESADDKWKPENIGEVIMYGADLSVSVQPCILLKNPDFIVQNLYLGYSYINSAINGDLPAYSKFTFENLKNQITSGYELRLTKKIYQTMNVRYCDRVNMDDYTVADIRIGWQSRNLNIYFDITNLFNVVYKESNFVELPGRWLKAGASYTFRKK